MSSITILGDTSGSVLLQAPAVAGSSTVTLPTTGGTIRTTTSAGTILQVIQLPFPSNLVTTSTSYVTTSVTLSITPSSANNKILISVNGGKTYSNTALMACRMYRNGSDVFGANAQWTPFEGGGGSNHSFCYLDSPSTTSTVTYTPYFRSHNGNSVYFTDSPATWGVVYMTAMEIAA